MSSSVISRRRWTLWVLVVLHPQMRDLLFAHQPTQGVLELRLLDEKVVLGIDRWCVLRTLEEEGEPLLDAAQACPPRQVREENQIEHERCGENGVPTQEIDLHLHRVSQPAEDVQVVPAFLAVAARRVVVD